MTNKVSFEGVGQTAATFFAADGVKAGAVVKLSGDAKVAPCAAGERFCGVATTGAEGGCAGVQVSGFAVVACADTTVTAGYVSLTADGSGGVKKAADADAGAEHLVVSVSGGSATILM